MGLNEKSLWVITADHGEGLSSHGIRGHERAIYNEQVRVPLIIHHPDSGRGARRQRSVVAHVDLVPTILEYAGVSTDVIPEDHRLRGQSLCQSIDDEFSSPVFAISELSAQSGRAPGAIAIQGRKYKYIRWSDRPDEFFDIEVDGCEIDNRIGDPAYSEPSRRLADALSRWEAEVEQITRGLIVPLGDDAKLLRSLGYVD